MQSQAPCYLAVGAMPSYNINSAEGRKLLQNQAKVAFVSELQAIGGTTIAFGASIMPRVVWAKCLTLAIASLGALGDPDAILAVLDSELGNSSQLGTQLVSEGTIKRTGVEVAAKSLAATLAERAAAKS